MSGGLGALSTALSGLRAAQKGIDVTSANISNVSTPGYTKKQSPQSTLIIGNEVAGVKLDLVTRSISTTLRRDIINQTSLTSTFETRQFYLDQIQTFNQPGEDEQSIAAQISALRDSFADLSLNVQDPFQLEQTVVEAQDTVRKINDLASLFLQLRNDTQDDMRISIERINTMLERIATLNQQIKFGDNVGRSTVDLQDQRDQALKDLAEEMEISTFQRGDGVIVVQDRQGTFLADESAEQIFFSPTPLGPLSVHPTSAAGVFVRDPTLPSTTDIAAIQFNGRLGELINLRDRILPNHTAQLDEMVQKLAERFDSQGLRLFTDGLGNVPASVAAPAPVTYTGFSSNIQVNQAVLSDPTLLRSGTTGNVVQPGSTLVVRKVLDFVFGENDFQRVTGNVDISGPATLFTTLGLTQQARVTGNVAIQGTGDLIANTDINDGESFDMQFNGGPVQTITLNAPFTATDLVNAINAAFLPTEIVASFNALGQIVLNGTGDITISNNTIGPEIADIGLAYGTTTATNPSFDVVVNEEITQTIEILPADTGADLVTKLQAVPLLDARLQVATGFLEFDPLEGGALSFIDNPPALPAAALGLVASNIPHGTFRTTNLGPNADIDINIASDGDVNQFTQRMIGNQSEQAFIAESKASSESSFLQTLSRNFLDQSGVNLDEEMSNLIRLQTSFSASTRTITAVRDLFDELLAAVR